MLAVFHFDYILLLLDTVCTECSTYLLGDDCAVVARYYVLERSSPLDHSHERSSEAKALEEAESRKAFAQVDGMAMALLGALNDVEEKSRTAKQ